MKFQWSKVAAVLGSYEDFIKNYGMSINSTDFSSGQVEAQLDTISAKLTQLKATLTAIVDGAGNSGLTSVFKGILESINSFLRGLQGISASSYKTIGVLATLAGGIWAITNAFKLARSVMLSSRSALTALTTASVAHGTVTSANTVKTELNAVAERLRAISKSVGASSEAGATMATMANTLATMANSAAVKEATVATGAWATAMTIATGGLNLVLAALTAVTVGTVAYSQAVGDTSAALDNFNQKSIQHADNLVQEVSNLRKQKEWLDTMCQQYIKLTEALKDTSLEEDKRKRIASDLIATEQEISNLIGEEGLARIKSSQDVVAQIEKEKSAFNSKADSMIENARNEINVSIETTQNLIEDSTARMEQMRKEMGVWARFTDTIWGTIGAMQEFLVKKTATAAGVEGFENWKSSYTLEKEQQDADFKASLEKQLSNLQKRRTSLEESLAGAVKPDTGEIPEAPEKGGSSGGSGSEGDAYREAMREFREALAKAKYDAESQGNYFSKTQEYELFKEIMGDSFVGETRFGADLLNKQRAGEKEQRDIANSNYDVEYFKRQLNPDFSKAIETSIAQTVEAGKPLSKSMEKLRRLIDEVNFAYKGSPEHIKAMAKLYEAELQQQTQLEKNIRTIRENGIKSLETMADKELEFAKSLGLVNDSDIRRYKEGRNEQEHSRNMPYLENELMKTAQAGMEEEILSAYHAFKMAQTQEDVEYSARYLMSLSGDVNATKSAVDAMLKEDERYHQEKYRIETENFKESAKYAIAAKDSFVSSFEDGLNGILERTMSFGDAMRNIFKNIAKSIIHTFTKEISGKLEKILAKAFLREEKSDNLGGALIGHLGGSVKVGGKKSSGLSGLFGSIPMPTMNFMGGGGKKAMNPMASLTSGLDKFQTSLANVKGTWTNTMGTMSTTASATANVMSNFVTEGVNTFTTGEIMKRTESSTTAASVMADGAATQTAVTANIGAMVAQMLAAMAIMFVLSSLFGGGGSSTSTSTSEVNLGRAPDSYYMTPTPVMQSTTFNVPSFDIGGNIEQDMFAMVHKGEMVLTPEQADVIRNTATSGGSLGGGANATVKSNISVNTVDSRGFDRVLKNYNRTLSKQVKSGIRNGFLNAKGLV